MNGYIKLEVGFESGMTRSTIFDSLTDAQKEMRDLLREEDHQIHRVTLTWEREENEG